MKKIIFISFVFCLNFVFVNNSWAKSFSYDFNDRVAFSSFDGTRITGNVFIPEGHKNEKFPAIIFVNSWTLNEYEYLIQAREFARNGYIVLSLSARGWGFSEGTVTVCSPDTDMKDIAKAIDWLIANSPVDEKNIGMSGMSYGGGMSLMAAAFEPRIKTVVAMSGWSDLEYTFYNNQSFNLAWGALLYSIGKVTGRLDDSILQSFQSLLLNKNTEEAIAWARKRSPAFYLDQINARKVPIYITNNFGDHLFKPNALIKFYQNLKGPKKLDLNWGGHIWAEAPGLVGIDNYLWKNTHDWFDYWLKGIDTGIMEQNPVNFQVVNKIAAARTQFEAWPSLKTSLYNLFVNNKTRRNLPDLGERMIDGTEYLGIDQPPHQGVLEFTAGVDSVASTFSPKINLMSFNPENGLLYLSKNLENEFRLRGMAQMKLKVSSNISQLMLNAYLYDVNEYGTGQLITHTTLTRREVSPGQVYDVQLEMIATAYDVQPGHRIALIIDSMDPQYAPPTTSKYKVKVYIDGDNTLKLSVPFLK